MSRKSTFNSNSIVNHTRKTLLIQSFLGDDLTSPQTQVSERRAIYSKNYMYRDGYVQKRFAYEQIAKVPSLTFFERTYGGEDLDEAIANPARINGMWNFIAEDGERHIVAHVGHVLYEIEDIGGNPSFKLISGSKNIEGVTHSFKLLDQKSYASVGQNRLWVLGGNKYLVVRFQKEGERKSACTVEPVANSSLTFVPTTTIGIAYKDAITGTRSGLDYPNMLSKFRKNMLLSGVGKSEGATSKFYEYTLDAPIVFENEAKDMGEMRETVSKRGEVKGND